MGGDCTRKALLYEEIARVGMALSSGKRLELLDLLAQSERTVDALARAAGLNLTTTSAHLQTLKHGGLVATRRAGTRVFYRLAGDDVADLYARLRTVAATHRADVVAPLSAYLGEDTEPLTREELRRRAATGEITVLDVRPREEYRAGHIPGALSIPLDELAQRLAELPHDLEVVAYCRGAYCVLAPHAVRLLSEHGHPARRPADGMLEWHLAGMPIEAGARDAHDSRDANDSRTGQTNRTGEASSVDGGRQ